MPSSERISPVVVRCRHCLIAVAEEKSVYTPCARFL